MQTTPADARMYWIAQRMRTDQFAVLGFDGPIDLDALRATVRPRVASEPDLQVRMWDVPGHLDLPYWVPRPADLPIDVHPGTGPLDDALGRLVATALDVHVSPWRLHVYPAAGVVVVQVSHALADGARTTGLVRTLFGTAVGPARPAPAPPRPAVATARGLLRFGPSIVRTVRAARAARDRSATSPRSGFAPTSLDVDPGPRRSVRMLTVPTARLRARGDTVTVAALTAIGDALGALLRERGDDVGRLGAEVTIAHERGANRNSYRNVGIDLRTDLRERTERAAAIREAVRAARAAAPRTGGRSVDDEVPARWARRGVFDFPLDLAPATVAGNTVVSSVHRGPADLVIGAARSVWAAGFPALSPSTALTHGVFGLGDTVTLTVLSSPDVLSGSALDEHLARIVRAL